MFKKLFLVLVLFVAIIYGNTVTKSYSFTETPQVKDGKVYLDGCHLRYTHFAPSVVEKPVVLLLPDGQEAVSVDVAYEGKVVLQGEYELNPVFPGVRIDAPPPARSFYETRSEVYTRNEFYPPIKRSQWFNNQYKNGHPIVITTVNPVQYNPVTSQIQYYKNITVTVHTQPQEKAVAAFCTPSIKSELASMVDNPEAVANLANREQRAGEYEYLIITTDALKDAWGTFVTFNAERCLRTKIQTVAYINANGTGSDLQQKIRNYIKGEYTNNKITYLMLGADDATTVADDCAARLFGCKFWDHDQTSTANLHEESDIPADMYYECLDGEWKKTGDPYYGAPGSQDMTWEVFSGRFPADNATHLNAMIAKTTGYSKTPVAAEIRKLYLAGNYLWTNNGIVCTGGQNVDEHIGTCNANGYTTIGFNASEWAIQKLYEQSADQWTIAQLRSGLKTHKPTMYLHDGHGNEQYVWCEQTGGVTTTNYPQNGGSAGNYMIAISGACLPGAFAKAQDCIMEAFAKLTTGFVATISNAKSGWGDNDGTDGCTHRPYRYQIDGLFNPAKKMHHLGRLHAHGKESVKDIVLNTDLNTPPYFYCITYCIYETILMGDPALSVWTNTPQTMTATYPTPLSSTTFTWETGQPYTWVALVNNTTSEIIATQLTGIDGKCSITSAELTAYINANPSGTLKVRAKAHNYYPFEGTLPIGGQGILDKSNTFKFISAVKANGSKVNVSYVLPSDAKVSVALYNSKGMLVRNVGAGHQNAGQHNTIIDCPDLGCGLYYCRLSVDNKTMNNKVFLSK